MDQGLPVAVPEPLTHSARLPAAVCRVSDWLPMLSRPPPLLTFVSRHSVWMPSVQSSPLALPRLMLPQAMRAVLVPELWMPDRNASNGAEVRRVGLTGPSALCVNVSFAL